MKKRIKADMSRDELDSFLQDQYGYGIWEFEYSFGQIYSLFLERRRIPINKFIDSRIELLKSMKNRIFEILDNFLENINFYKWNDFLNIVETKKWTSENRIKFILDSYKLNEFISTIDDQIKIYEKQKTYSIYDKCMHFGFFPPNIKPLNLLILTWSYALKRGGKRDWINLENLLEWFSIRIKDIDKLNLFEIEPQNIPDPATLRLTWHKYKKSGYNVFANITFYAFFEIYRDEEKNNSPQPLFEMKKFLDDNYWWEKRFIKDADIYMFIEWIYLFSGLKEKLKSQSNFP